MNPTDNFPLRLLVMSWFLVGRGLQQQMVPLPPRGLSDKRASLCYCAECLSWLSRKPRGLEDKFASAISLSSSFHLLPLASSSVFRRQTHSSVAAELIFHFLWPAPFLRHVDPIMASYIFLLNRVCVRVRARTLVWVSPHIFLQKTNLSAEARVLQLILAGTRVILFPSNVKCEYEFSSDSHLMQCFAVLKQACRGSSLCLI